MPVTRVSSTRRTCGIWVDVQTVNSSLMPIGAATTARGSMNDGIRRWLMKRRLTMTIGLGRRLVEAATES